MPDTNIEARLIPEQGIQTEVDLRYLNNPNDLVVKHDDTLKGDGIVSSLLGISDDILNQIKRGGDTFVFEFDASQTSWQITHNLHKKPSVTVVDSADTVMVCAVRYNNDDTLTIELNAAFKGTAYLN